MTHRTLQSGAPNLPLAGGMILKLEARSTTTDAEVASVLATRWAIYGYDASQAAEEAGPGALLVSTWT